ncbi:ribonuclease P protein component [Kovacikia minuta CCNUW1]|uniref:ribonuclease P protein component n=1 Tax=Kovacikia minuta TaxID=2931930 RepID=UPI001CCE1A0F|nr:ribonuclease P protein component [Kovacikia minuta]UBF24783.1 ribonuclease P protein component [Kovacikia minuta CCNUW1]
MALPKANRLKRRQDFNAVYQRGIRRRSKHLTLFALRQKPVNSSGWLIEDLGQHANPPVAQITTQIGISISQKVSKRAVVRNRIKRRIRAALRPLLPKLSPGLHLVIVVQPQAVQCDYLQFLRELEQLLIDAEVFNGHS